MGLALRFIGLGWYVAFCIVIGIMGGFWLDHVAGTLPLFVILGTLLGVAAAFYGIYKLVQPLLKEAEPKREDNNTPDNNTGEGKT
jgi:F0F1-type ATP synthase assembly protein I